MILKASKLLSCPGRPIINNGAVLVEHGIIRAIGSAVILTKRYPRHKILDCSGSVLMPGLVNVHAHLELPLIVPPRQATTYTQWVMNLIKAKRRLTRQQYRSAAHQNIDALIRTGTTTVADISTEGASPAFLSSASIRAVIYHEIISMAPLDDLSDAIPKLPRRSRLVTHGFSPHTPHTVSERVIRGIRDVSLRKHIPVCMHVAESSEESDLLQGKPSGLEVLYRKAGWRTEWAPRAGSSFSYLFRTGILKTPFLAVHAVQVDNDDLEIIRKTGIGIAHCPRSNSALGVGVMPLRQMLDLAIPVGLGTDSLASVPTLSMWDEIRFALKVHRRSGVAPVTLLQMAAAGGAKALGLDDRIGSIEPGKQADIIAVPLPRRDTGDLCSDLLRETESCSMSMVNGKVLYRQPLSC